MRKTLALLPCALLSALLVLAACGNQAEDPKAQGSPTSGTPATTTSPGPAKGPTPAGPTSSWTGSLEPMGVSIYMQGSHRLVDGGKTVALVTSTRVDLKKYEGKRVTVKGAAAPTVEGNQTIVDVQEIQETP